MHVIADLGQGGAEMVLYRLVKATLDDCDHLVVSLHSDGVLGPRLRDAGIRVECLGLPRGRTTIRGLRRLVALVREVRPDIVQTRLYHGNLLGGIAAWMASDAKIHWAIHATDLGGFFGTWKTRLVRRIGAVLSWWIPEAILFDAERALRLHRRMGYRSSRCRVIDNGIDLDLYQPDAAARSHLRAELGIGEHEFLLGCVARWDPLKDHANLIAALAHLARQGTVVRCMLVGRGMTAGNQDLAGLIEHHRVGAQVILAGPRSDIAGIMNGLDLHVLSSVAESAPVCAVEAMACGTPCVVTDVGDSVRIVGSTGWHAPPRDPKALASAIESGIRALRERGGAALGAECRARAESEFGVRAMADRYLDAWNGGMTG